MIGKAKQLFIPDKLTEFTIDKGQKFFTIPAFSAQGYYLFLTGRYGVGSELEFQKVFASLIKEGDIIIDVGAHFGFYTLICAERVGNSGMVLAFEPSSFNYEILTLNVNKNKYKNIKLFNLALGDSNTVAKLGLPKGGKSGENTMAIKENNIEFVESIQVRRFDTLKILSKPPDLVKIDVEGAEVQVLKGFGNILNDIKYILCEIHPMQMNILGTNTNELFEILYSKEFSLYLIQTDRKLIKLTDPNTITERSHIIAINTTILNERKEVKKLLRILQLPYTLGTKKPPSSKIVRYIHLSLRPKLSFIKTKLLKFERLFSK